MLPQVVDVPEDCVGFVMGKGGNTLRQMEEEWGTLMFFAQVGEPGHEETEKLCIFGALRSRRGAELKVMSAVEHKHPGHFVRGETLLECRRIPGDDAGSEWCVFSSIDILLFPRWFLWCVADDSQNISKNRVVSLLRCASAFAPGRPTPCF